MSAVVKAPFNAWSEMAAALWVEFRKVRRSKTLWLTALLFSFMTLIGGLFMFILKYPDLATRLGIVGAKAQIIGGSADWPNFFAFMLLFASVGGLVIFGFIFVWVFGREFGDKTIYDLLSLPTSRMAIVTAKIITASYWSMGLILLAFLLMMGIGAVLRLPLWSMGAALDELARMLVAGFLTLLLCIPFALAASLARGYMAAIGCIFLVLFLGQVSNTLGFGQYFPWAIPMLYTGAASTLTGAAAQPLGLTSYLLVGLVGAASLVLTGAWWRNADQS